MLPVLAGATSASLTAFALALAFSYTAHRGNLMDKPCLASLGQDKHPGLLPRWEAAMEGRENQQEAEGPRFWGLLGVGATQTPPSCWKIQFPPRMYERQQTCGQAWGRGSLCL